MYKDKERAKEYQKEWRELHKEYCKAKQKEYYKKYYQERRDKILAEKKEYGRLHPEEGRRGKYFRRYGIYLEEYNQMVIKQGGCCAICGVNELELKRHLFVDHDHKTGKIRGLLCQTCNNVLGYSYDCIDILQKAILYLKSSGNI